MGGSFLSIRNTIGRSTKRNNMIGGKRTPGERKRE
jgi:hypothetical protein